MPNIVYCDYCKESFDIKKLTVHRNKCKKNPNTNAECKYCKKEFSGNEIKKHLIECKKHNKSKNNIFIVCKHCNENILSKYLSSHKSWCPKNPENWGNIEDYEEDKSSEISQKKLFPKKNKLVIKKYTGDNAYLANDDGSIEFLGKQEKSKVKLNKNKNILKSNDSYYNSTTKDNTSFSIRDKGEFGSLPLHDNYDEESNAE